MRTVTVPVPDLGPQRFVVSAAGERTAAGLFVLVAALGPPTPGVDDDAAAVLERWRRLADEARQRLGATLPIAEVTGCWTVEALGLRMLTELERFLTAGAHAGRAQADADHGAREDALAQARTRLADYGLALGRLAEIDQPEHLLGMDPSTSPLTAT